MKSIKMGTTNQQNWLSQAVTAVNRQSLKAWTHVTTIMKGARNLF